MFEKLQHQFLSTLGFCSIDEAEMTNYLKIYEKIIISWSEIKRIDNEAAFFSH